MRAVQIHADGDVDALSIDTVPVPEPATLTHNQAGPDEDALVAVGATGAAVMVQSSSTQLTEIATLIDEGKVKVTIDSVFSLDDVKSAHVKSQTGRAKGKIVIEVVAA